MEENIKGQASVCVVLVSMVLTMVVLMLPMGVVMVFHHYHRFLLVNGLF